MSDDEQIRIIYDPVLRRPGCVLLQAIGGGDSFAVQTLFDCKIWLTHPTPDMRGFVGTREQWKQVAALKPRPEATEGPVKRGSRSGRNRKGATT